MVCRSGYSGLSTFFILSLQVAFLGVVYWGMTATGPYLAYILTKKYKQVIGGKISFFHALQFGILIYFFAALIISLVHYIFYQYIAPADYIENSYKKSIEMMVAINMDSAIIEAVRNMGTPSNISMTIQGIFNNTMYGIVFSIPGQRLSAADTTPPNHPNKRIQITRSNNGHISSNSVV